MAKGVLRRRLTVLLCLAVPGLVLLLLCSSMNCLVWDGGYPPAEFQATFTDEGGRPLEGVELRVEDREGHAYFHYPVTDYLPEHVPTSDRHGLMTFHHATHGLEFGGKSCGLFGFGETKAPQYVCRFVFRGEEVYRASYHDLNDWELSGEPVKRRWREPAWPASQLLMKPGEEYDAWRTRARAFFDLNHNGNLEPEEAAAYRAATNYRAEEAAEAELRGETKEEDVEFPVLRKAIVVRVPGR
jgi:hypothetical protein